MAKKYSAYKSVMVSDGIFDWPKHKFDMTKEFTADDLEKFKRELERASPEGRIASMQKALKKAQRNHPRIKKIEALLTQITPIPSNRDQSYMDRFDSVLKEAVWLWRDYLVQTRLVPDALKGQKFKAGRVKGAVSPLTAAVRERLQYDSGQTAAQVWDALAANPPESCEFFDNAQGKYVEYSSASGLANTNYRRFQNIVSEQRKALQQR